MTNRAAALAATCLLVAAAAGAQTSYDDLVSLDGEVTRLRAVADVSPESIQTRADALAAFKERLARFDTSSWPVSRRIDYLLVWAKVNAQEFEHRVTKPWARDALFYLYRVNRIPYVDLPADGEALDRLTERLADVPSILQQARENLTEGARPLASLALFHLENFDGVGQRQPYRDDPPEGTIGWYRDLCGRLARDHASLVPSCEEALAAVEGYRDWLSAEIGGMAESAAVGRENLDWYLTHVRMVPYTVDEVVLLGKRELHRFRFDYVVERRKNQNVPELELTTGAAMHEARTREAEEQIRGIVDELSLLTIPPETPATFETDTYWSPRAATYRHFWEELQFRNALNNHIHASIPGHRWDSFMKDRLSNPVRMTFQDTGRAEGWGTYLEEMLMQAGITDDNPRARELFYIALIKRGSRIYAETAMHSGAMSLDEANEYMIDYVPYMEEKLGRYDLEGYLRRPGSGSMYIIGKIQIERLVSERAHQLGDEFDLGEFHDDFLSRGIIPVSLLRWEMTGLEDEVRTLWEAVVGKPF